jgi:hypothetical protein
VAPFFAAFCLYTWLVIDPSLLYGCTSYFPAFSRGREFAANFLWCPGGPVKYLAALLYQFYYYAWAGALVTTAVAVALYWSTHLILAALLGFEVRRWAALLPPLLVLAGAGQYGCNLAALLALTVAVLAAAALLTARARGLATVWAVLLYGGACVVLSYAVAGPLLIFAVVCAAYEVRRGASWPVGLCYVLGSEVVALFLGVRILDVSAQRAWFALLPLGDWADPHALDPLGLWPLRALCLYFLAVAWSPALARGRAGAVAWLHRPAASLEPVLRALAAGSVVPVALVLVVGVLTSSNSVKHCLRAQRYFRLNDWDGVLQEAAWRRGSEVLIPLCHQANAALAQKGRLLDDMFVYPQSPHSLLVGTAAPHDAQRETADAERLVLYPQLGGQDLELGLVNEAEHQAHEALEVWGPHPVALWRLAEINCLKGRPEVARVFLTALSRDLIWRSLARRAAAELDHGTPRAMQGAVHRIRPVMLQDDSCTDADFDRLCHALLARNPRNRLAVEYLFAYHLLRYEPWRCAENIPLLKAAGYPKLPRHLQEAFVLLETQPGTRLNLLGYTIDAETRTRFAGFTRIMDAAHARADALRASPLVAPEYGNSLFYYYVFHESGVGRR